MKISFKIPAVATLGGLVLCAGVLSAYANGADSENEYTVGDYYVSGAEHPIYEKYKDHGLPETHTYKIGEGPVFLTEYPEELFPYIEELERINAELGTDLTFSSEVSEADDAIDFFTSLSIEEFRDYIYGAYDNAMAHPLPFDEYAMPETSDPEDDILAGRIIMAESGGYWYRQDTYGSGNIVVTPQGELTSDDDGTGFMIRKDSTEEATDPKIGIYRGDGWVYHVYRCE